MSEGASTTLSPVVPRGSGGTWGAWVGRGVGQRLGNGLLAVAVAVSVGLLGSRDGLRQ